MTASLDQIESICRELPDEFYLLAEIFLPGPLCIILKKSKNLPEFINSGFDTVGIRLPDNNFCLELIKRYGRAIASTSANMAEQPPALNGDEALLMFNNKIPLIIDSGYTSHKVESTVISLAGKKHHVLRWGAIKKESLEEILKIKLD